MGQTTTKDKQQLTTNANDHPDRLTSCKWSFGSTSLLQIIIRIDQPLANNPLDQPASYKWSSGSTGLLRMIIWMDQPLANDHRNGPASCKWSSFSFSVILLLCKKAYFPSPNIFLLFLYYKSSHLPSFRCCLHLVRTENTFILKSPFRYCGRVGAFHQTLEYCFNPSPRNGCYSSNS